MKKRKKSVEINIVLKEDPRFTTARLVFDKLKDKKNKRKHSLFSKK